MKLTWLAKYDDHASMGILSQRVIEKLTSDVSCKSIIGESKTTNKLINDLLEKPINSDIGIMFAYPDIIHELNPYKIKVIYTGVDTTGGIPNFSENINKADYILTPSNRSKEMMINLGVKKPIFVFKHGIDPNIFTYKDRIKKDKFRFLYVGECSDRKGIFQLLTSFISLYGNNNNVELYIKSNSDMIFYNGDEIRNIINKYSNIIWDINNNGHDEMINLYQNSHAYIYPSRADTFGMTLLEAMACGLPIISTDLPGASEIIDGRYYKIDSNMTPVMNHPWMLGEWGEPLIDSIKTQMDYVYNNYDFIINSGDLKTNSDYIRNNYSWGKIVNDFEENILTKFKKPTKVITMLTSYNRPHHIESVINSLKMIREDGIINDVYIIDNTEIDKEETVNTIKNNIDEHFKLHISDFNLGQRGSLLQLLEDVNIDEYDFIQFTDQDNIFNEKISVYCNILYDFPSYYIATGYMSKEHPERNWINSDYGFLCGKRTCRAGHMIMKVDYLKSLLPIHLDSQFNKWYNSSWNAGLDWEILAWNPNACGRITPEYQDVVLCVPGGVLHKGYDSTMYDWDVENNEYSLDELIIMRKQGK